MRLQILFAFAAVAAASAYDNVAERDTAAVSGAHGAPTWKRAAEPVRDHGAPTWKRAAEPVRDHGAPTWKRAAEPLGAAEVGSDKGAPAWKGPPAWKRAAEPDSLAAPPMKRADTRAARMQARGAPEWREAPRDAPEWREAPAS